MGMDTKLRLNVEQKLTMTPALHQALALLQKSRAELVEEIRREMEENPALDAEDSGRVLPRAEDGEAAARPSREPDDMLSEPQETFQALWQASRGELMTGRVGWSETPEAAGYESFTPGEETLAEHLLWQLEISAPTPRLRAAGEMLIGHLDEAGYLRTPLEDLGAASGVPLEELSLALEILQGMDPPGVGARDLRECLLLQARSFGMPEDSLTVRVIRSHLSLVERKRFADIAAAEGCGAAEAEEICDSLRHFAPKPGLQYSTRPNPTVVPDVFVYRAKGHDYRVALNEDGMPRLRISSATQRLLAEGDQEVQSYLRERMRSARWLIRCFYQRQRTIYRVAEAIVRRQRGFFEEGPSRLVPMTLAELAAELEIHPSTVSRVVKGKYLQCPRGVIELRFFLQSAARPRNNGGAAGEDAVSSARVRERVRQLVAAEDPRKPLTDEAMVLRLKVEGMPVARRTVAKYREDLGVASSSGRRRR
jgi:RNA polymerase sigma-54 factor